VAARTNSGRAELDSPSHDREQATPRTLETAWRRIDWRGGDRGVTRGPSNGDTGAPGGLGPLETRVLERLWGRPEAQSVRDLRPAFPGIADTALSMRRILRAPADYYQRS
jgi:hypothetical protein